MGTLSTNTEFETINKSNLSNLNITDSSKLSFITSSLSRLQIREIQRYEYGIFFEITDSGYWGDGYFRSEVHSDSLVNHLILTHIVDDWYHWYQDQPSKRSPAYYTAQT